MNVNEDKAIGRKLLDHIWNQKSRTALIAWLKLLFSWRGLVVFGPGILGVFFVYWAKNNGYEQTFLNKGRNEVLALWLMGATTAIMLVRVILYRFKVDIVVFIAAANFLCREIHFDYGGSDGSAITITVIALLLALYWEQEVLDKLIDARWFQVCMTGTIFTYLLAFLIQKRVFTPKRLPFLPNEGNMHVPLEEFLEDVAHLFFLVTAIVAFYSICSMLMKKTDEPVD